MPRSPEQNIAWDDTLLEREQETFRFWESPVPVVVLGRSGRPELDVNLPACAAEGVPILRRSSGGGTVLLGPGCLNYALVLSLTTRPELTSVARSYEMILGWVVQAIALPGLEVAGSDILLDGRKVSGNSQRRTRGWLLHHGTLLYEPMDLSQMERLLHEPVRQPPHRKGKSHAQFLAKLPLTREDLMARLYRTTTFVSPALPGLWQERCDPTCLRSPT
jgi:lipoate-protein ligase A